MNKSIEFILLFIASCLSFAALFHSIRLLIRNKRLLKILENSENESNNCAKKNYYRHNFDTSLIVFYMLLYLLIFIILFIYKGFLAIA